MTETIAFFQKGMALAMWLTLPPLAVAVVTGIAVSLLQTMLSAQDQALPFAVKLIAVGMTLAFVGRWQGLQLLALGEQALQAIPNVSHRVPERAHSAADMRLSRSLINNRQKPNSPSPSNH